MQLGRLQSLTYRQHEANRPSHEDPVTRSPCRSINHSHTYTQHWSIGQLCDRGIPINRHVGLGTAASIPRGRRKVGMKVHKGTRQHIHRGETALASYLLNEDTPNSGSVSLWRTPHHNRRGPSHLGQTRSTLRVTGGPPACCKQFGAIG